MTKYGRPDSRGPGVEDAGDVDMVHHRQGLPLGLEAGDDLPAVHARLDDLEGDLALDRLGLLGHIDDAHAPFADLLQQLVGADLRAGAFGSRLVECWAASRGNGRWRNLEEATQQLLGPQQALDVLAKGLVVTTRLLHDRPSAIRRPAISSAASKISRSFMQRNSISQCGFRRRLRQ